MKEETICQHLREEKLAYGHVQAINFSIFPIKYAKRCIFSISDYEHDLADFMHENDRIDHESHLPYRTSFSSIRGSRRYAY